MYCLDIFPWTYLIQIFKHYACGTALTGAQIVKLLYSTCSACNLFGKQQEPLCFGEKQFALVFIADHQYVLMAKSILVWIHLHPSFPTALGFKNVFRMKFERTREISCCTCCSCTQCKMHWCYVQKFKANCFIESRAWRIAQIVNVELL